MAKNNFLLVDLNETKTKKLAETITSDTSRKILNYLAEKEETEANLAEMLKMPISTVHYHLQKLQEAGLVLVEEFHYSPKGREVNHYKLANKYIIISPKKIAGLKEKLKGILPVALGALGISAILKVIQTGQTKNIAILAQDRTKEAVTETAQAVLKTGGENTPSPEVLATPDIAFWFLVGSFVTIILYLLTSVIRDHWRNK